MANINLQLGDIYYSVQHKGKPFEVVRLDTVKEEVMGFYLACFRGSETEAIYISKLKGPEWFNQNWSETHRGAWKKEIESLKRKISCLEEVLQKLEKES